MKYAADTQVPVERSKAEIEATLMRYGASAFQSGWDNRRAVIEFLMSKRRIRFVLPLPDRTSTDITHRRGNQSASLVPCTPEQSAKRWEQACRQRWRALSLVVKAKLEAVQTGITTFDDEFLAHIVLPSGETCSQWLVPQIESAYQAGSMPTRLLALPEGDK